MKTPLRVLLAEDNPADAEFVLRELRRSGFEPEWERVDTEADFLARLHAGIDIVLSDYQMPQFSGPRALELLHGSGLDIPFIIISGTIGEDIAVDVMKLGASDYLLKDRLKRLGSAIGHAMEQGRLRRERKRAEEALRQSEAEFRAVSEASPLGIFVTDSNGLATYTNGTLRRMLGVGFQEIAAKGWASSLHPMDREDLLASWQEAIASQKNFEGCTRFIHPDGTVIQTSIRTAVMREHDRVLGYMGVVEDITVRKAAEETLRESEERFSGAFMFAPIGVALLSPDGHWLKVNQALCDLVGYSEAEMLTLTFQEITHPEDLQADLDNVRRIIAGEIRSYQMEKRYVHARGHFVAVSLSVSLVRDVQGEPLYFISQIQDITERKRSEARFRRLVDSNVQGVIFWNMKGEITGANDAFLRLTGHTREDLAAGRLNWIAMTPPEFADLDRRALAEIAARGSCAPFEKIYFRKDGSRVPLLFGAAIFEDNPEEGVCFVLDLTERKKLEQQLLRAQRLESIGTLASGIAHDLNNILAPIMMAVPMLRRELSEEDREGIISTVEMSAERGAQIVRQVLTFGRGVEGEKRPLQIGTLISDMVKIAHGTFPKDITIESTVKPGLWPVLGDATQMHQILLNLCINARDAMPDGGKLRLSARNLLLDENFSRTIPGSSAGPHVLLEVSDNGSGIPPGIIERIFDPFFTTKGIGQGTGLGLSTVLGIVKNHDGHITVASNPGKGTTFQIYLPASRNHMDAAAVSGLAESPPEGHGKCILVVDDEEAVRGAARTVLEAHGYRVLESADGTEALAVFARHSAEIAAVLTDLMMPHMDGVALIHALRKMQPEVPIIVSTGLGEKARSAELKALNVEAVLNKPYGASILMWTVHEALQPAANGATITRLP